MQLSSSLNRGHHCARHESQFRSCSRVFARGHVSCRSTADSNANNFDTDEITKKARQFAHQASRSFQKFVSDNKLDEAAQQMHENAEKLGSQAAQRAKATFDEADRRLSLRVRARNLLLYVKETTPKLSREVSAFVETPLGRVAMFLAVAWAAYTGLLLRLINWFFLMVWLSPLILPFVARVLNKKAMEEADRQAHGSAAFNPGRTAAGGQRYGWYAPPGMRQQQWNPNAAPWGQTDGADGPKNPFWGRKSPQQQRYSQQPGPVIDAEWTTVDKD